MTLNPNTHPFVYEIKSVDSSAYPELETLDIIADNVDMIIASDNNIYATFSLFDIVASLNIVRLQRQDFHIHYYVATSVSTISPVNPIPAGYLFRSRYGTGEHLYVMYNSEDNSIGVQRYTVTGIGLTFDVGWSLVIPNDGDPEPDGYSNSRRYYSGLFESDMYIYCYKYSTVTGIVAIYRSAKTGVMPGDEISVRNVELPTGLASVSISLDLDQETLYIAASTDPVPGPVSGTASTYLASLAQATDDPYLAARDLNNPAMDLTAVGSSLVNTASGDSIHSTVYQYREGGFHISFTNGSDPDNDGNLSSLDLPMTYDLDRPTLYQEDHDPEQSVYEIAIKSLNQVVYMAYVTSSLQIRVVKLLYYKGATDARARPLVLWSTRLGSVDHYYGAAEAAGGIKLMVNDEAGGGEDQTLYLAIRNGLDNVTRIWMIKEYIADLGHSVSTITAPVTTISDLLLSLRDEYTITGLNDMIMGHPSVKDVIIGDITEQGRDLLFRFDYINYDMLVLYEDIKESMRIAIADALTTLYRGSNVNVLDIDSSTIPGGGENYVLFSVPRGSLLKPCVVRGTDVMVTVSNGSDYYVKPVEEIVAGDYVINHLGEPVKVLEHLSSRIWCQRHNAPYVIPVNFFGEMRPYKELMISGDHGIMVNSKRNGEPIVVYAQDIRTLRQKMIKREVEYHHLLLEGHEKNFYLANGLEVDSLHPGVILRHHGGRDRK